jgi:hypothetical protein
MSNPRGPALTYSNQAQCIHAIKTLMAFKGNTCEGFWEDCMNPESGELEQGYIVMSYNETIAKVFKRESFLATVYVIYRARLMGNYTTRKHIAWCRQIAMNVPCTERVEGGNL